ncbi:hypothetical protein PS3A_46510 [Pseudomonas sp. 3A(2025)]
MDSRNPLINCLIFPVAPITVIYLTHILCREIWYANYYTPGEDGGEFEPAMAMLGIPILLIVAAFVLGGLTVFARWRAQGSGPSRTWRWLLAIPRILLASVCVVLFMTSTVFFMGDEQGIFRHWQVACAWVMFLTTVGMFVAQQYARSRE